MKSEIMRGVPVIPFGQPTGHLSNCSCELKRRAEAVKRDIVVEIKLFSSHYDEAQWNISALTPANHVHSTDSLDWHKIHTPKKNALKFQEQYVRKLVRGANTFDSVIFEIHTARGDQSLSSTSRSRHIPQFGRGC
jgi:hypothetical protein